MGNGPSILDYFNPNHEDMINRGQAGLAGKDDAKAPFDLAAIGDTAADFGDYAVGFNLASRGTKFALDDLAGKDTTYDAVMLAADLAADVAIVAAMGTDAPEVEVALGAEQTAAKSSAKVTPRVVPWGQGGKAITIIQGGSSRSDRL